MRLPTDKSDIQDTYTLGTLTNDCSLAAVAAVVFGRRWPRRPFWTDSRSPSSISQIVIWVSAFRLQGQTKMTAVFGDLKVDSDLTPPSKIGLKHSLFI